MKLLIHDLEKTEIDKIIGNTNEDIAVVDNTNRINNCIGCFGCWIKTPSSCVIKDSYMDMGKLIAKSDDIIIISKCVYGGYSPFIKNVLDRSISYVLPYFTIRKGEMHHKSRYLNQSKLSVYFYGEDITNEERITAQDLVTANALNLNMLTTNCSITRSLDDMKGELKWISL
ncbi:MAG: hypothetical protein K0S61_2988 [Anaerocolumna sp.]|jgi:multimeric flavodoxin WrbA|nr:hypothetical protein [Anaerocolumna sp.]